MYVSLLKGTVFLGSPSRKVVSRPELGLEPHSPRFIFPQRLTPGASCLVVRKLAMSSVTSRTTTGTSMRWSLFLSTQAAFGALLTRRYVRSVCGDGSPGFYYDNLGEGPSERQKWVVDVSADITVIFLFRSNSRVRNLMSLFFSIFHFFSFQTSSRSIFRVGAYFDPRTKAGMRSTIIATATTTGSLQCPSFRDLIFFSLFYRLCV